MANRSATNCVAINSSRFAAAPIAASIFAFPIAGKELLLRIAPDLGVTLRSAPVYGVELKEAPAYDIELRQATIYGLELRDN